MPITVSSLLFYYVVKKLDAKLLGQLLRGIFFIVEEVNGRECFKRDQKLSFRT